MKIVFRFIWVVSCLGLFWCLFKSYSEIATEVNLAFDRGIAPISRDVFFYGVGGVFLLYTIILISLVNIIPITPRKFLPIPNKKFWFSDYNHRKVLNKILQGWVYATCSVVNYFFMIVILLTWSRNHVYGAMPVQNSWQLPLGIAMIISLLAPFGRLSISKLDMLDNRKEYGQ